MGILTRIQINKITACRLYFLFNFCTCFVMDEELKCPVCRRIFNNPVTLVCQHSICLHCATGLEQQAVHGSNSGGSSNGSAESVSSTGSCQYDILSDIDKMSVISESDSGFTTDSRPSSYSGSGSLLSLRNTGSIIQCPKCRRLTALDQRGSAALPQARCLQNICSRRRSKQEPSCQMCDPDRPDEGRPASIECLECHILYCNSCLGACHPARGPLSKHTLRQVVTGQVSFPQITSSDVTCFEHNGRTIDEFCCTCNLLVCEQCKLSRHREHQFENIPVGCKSQKVSV